MRGITEYQGAERRIQNPFMDVAKELCGEKMNDDDEKDKKDGAKTGNETEMKKEKRNLLVIHRQLQIPRSKL
jgi:hypothetical protein